MPLSILLAADLAGLTYQAAAPDSVINSSSCLVSKRIAGPPLLLIAGCGGLAFRCLVPPLVVGLASPEVKVVVFLNAVFALGTETISHIAVLVKFTQRLCCFTPGADFFGNHNVLQKPPTRGWTNICARRRKSFPRVGGVVAGVCPVASYQILLVWSSRFVTVF